MYGRKGVQQHPWQFVLKLDRGVEFLSPGFDWRRGGSEDFYFHRTTLTDLDDKFLVDLVTSKASVTTDTEETGY